MRTEMEMPRTVRTQNKMNKHRPHFSPTSPFCGLQPSLSVRTALCGGRHHRRWMRAERLDRSAGPPTPPAPVHLPSATLSSHVRWQSSNPVWKETFSPPVGGEGAVTRGPARAGIRRPLQTLHARWSASLTVGRPCLGAGALGKRGAQTRSPGEE